jgi:hypothetical protein
VEVYLFSFITSALEGGGGLTSHPASFIPGKYPVAIVQEAGWVPWPVWTGAENLAATGIRSLDLPARSESLNRLRYPGPHLPCILLIILVRANRVSPLFYRTVLAVQIPILYIAYLEIFFFSWVLKMSRDVKLDHLISSD